jgi:diguanylate cyclase (GGDEF)-like protein/PAS domain S-box-containing protein
MADYSLTACLDLCRRARGLKGDALVHALAELENALGKFAANQQAVKPNPVAPAPVDALVAVADAVSMVRVVEEPIITLDMAGYITAWSERAEQMFGYAAQEVVNQHVLILYAEDDGEIAELFLEQGSPVMDVRRRKKSGEVFRAGLSLSVIIDEQSEPSGLEIYLTEIFDRLSDQDKLRLHARIIEDSDQGILITDSEERIVSINTAFTRITGYSPAEAIGKTPDLLRSGVHDENFRAEVRSAMHGSGPWQGEIVGRRKSGELFPQSVLISVVRNERGEITHAFSIFSDISRHKEAEARLQRLANYDTVTGLPNRSLFNQLAEQALGAARRTNGHLAMMVITLSRVSSINDTLGQEVGNDLLCRVGTLFRDILHDEDVLAKIENDKFLVTLPSIRKREHAGIVARKLLDALRSPFLVESHILHIGACIGISVYPEDGADVAVLTRYADVAMMRVQLTGENDFLFYSPEMNQRTHELLRIEGELRHALANGELQLHYQPKVSLRSGRIVGAEALIRWPHSEHGMIPPDLFIAVAEETGLIHEIGAWVVEEACRQIRQWRDEGLVMPSIAINLSARQFDANLPLRIQAALERHQVDPSMLKLEITESLLMRGAENVIPIMNQLVAMGLALALDDFGTGYSSLAYLKKFPISTLKIDRSFVVGLPHEENDCAIARAIVTMAQQLRQEIVAEGVENLAQMVFLRELGCDQLQGFLFSAAVTPAEFGGMVAAGKRLTLGN